MIDTKTKVTSVKTMKLYNGEIELKFNQNGHRYTVNGKDALGVTTVLGVISKPALMFWAVNEAVGYLKENWKAGVSYDEVQIKTMLEEAKTAHRKKKDTAADLGTMIHKWIEQYINGENPEPPINPEMQKAIQAFLLWVKKNNVKFIVSERVVYSRRYNYAGTTDFICEIDGKKYIGDIKTSNAIYSEYLMQVAAYRYALQEEEGSNYDGMMIIRVPKDDGEIEIREFNNYADHATAFIRALGLYRHLKSEELKIKKLTDQGVKS